MSLKDRLVFRRVVPRAARSARRVLTVSERTRADLVRLYGLPEAKVVVTPNGVDPAFTPGDGPPGTYALAVGAVQARKNQLAALEAAAAAGLPLVVAGPVKDEALAATLRERGADLRGYVRKTELAELYRGAACLVQPSRYEGFGLPVLEAMACGTPVVALDEPALREVAGGAASSSTRSTSRTACAAPSRSGTGWWQPGSSARRRSAGARPPSARSPCTARLCNERLRRRRLARSRA